MATFAKSSFNAARYAVSRPTYPRSLFESVFNYHEQSLALNGSRTRWEDALDLGCGTGQATVELLQSSGIQEGDEEPLGFDNVTGLDPSAKMIQGATAYAATLGARGSSLKFVTGPAENLSMFPDQSIDLVIAAQAAHWFDWERLWPELSRVLRHGGTAAFWVYSEFRLPQYPHLTPLITQYAQGTDRQTSLGPHWEPGRAILANHLLDIEPPSTGWDDFTRVFFTGDHYPTLPEPHMETIMRKTMTWGGAGLHGYLRTFSALNRFHEEFPEDREREDGDIATRFLRQLMQDAKVPLGAEGEQQTVEVEWPMALVLARKELDYNDPWLIRQKKLDARVDVLKKNYAKMYVSAEPPTTVEEMGEKMDRWIEVQEKVLAIIDADMADLPENENDGVASDEEVNDEEASDEEASDGEEAFIEMEHDGLHRYVDNLETTRMAVTWHLAFKRAFDTALELANVTEREVGREDVSEGIEHWIGLMQEKMAEVAPLIEADPEADEEPAEGDLRHGLTENQLNNLTDEQIEALENVEALENIVHIVAELAQAVGAEPITDLVREMYIQASTEVTREALV
ncbi:hypothetical protein DFH09DRAFT_1137236 [Mycena vulgaris]|nr:hypothetical protein DFH09DRAFT_1137236 [Mycena vulgaris]